MCAAVFCMYWKPIPPSSRCCSKPPPLQSKGDFFKKLKVDEYNESTLNVWTFVLGCVGSLLFSGEEKRSKKVAGDYYRDCVPANAPGRNYKLLPALAIDSPLGCQCGYAAASRPATLFG